MRKLLALLTLVAAVLGLSVALAGPASAATPREQAAYERCLAKAQAIPSANGQAAAIAVCNRAPHNVDEIYADYQSVDAVPGQAIDLSATCAPSPDVYKGSNVVGGQYLVDYNLEITNAGQGRHLTATLGGSSPRNIQLVVFCTRSVPAT